MWLFFKTSQEKRISYLTKNGKIFCFSALFCLESQNVSKGMYTYVLVFRTTCMYLEFVDVMWDNCNCRYCGVYIVHTIKRNNAITWETGQLIQPGHE